MMMKRFFAIGCFLLGVASGCGDDEAPDAQQESDQRANPAQSDLSAEKQARPTPPKPPPLQDPVPLWENGRVAKQVDAAFAADQGYLVLDLGESFTPYLLTEATSEDGTVLTNSYRETYLALARGEFPKDHHGERAREDKYLELYGILPTLSVLRDRLRKTATLKCAETLDLQPLIDFDGVVTYRSNPAARRFVRDYRGLANQVSAMVRRQGVESAAALNRGQLDRREQGVLDRFLAKDPAYQAIIALQDRLECEGFYRGRGKYLRGGLDWVTHEALAEFERKHRVYSWGYIGRDSQEVLRLSPLESGRRAVLRVLTERAILASGVIEDGSVPSKRNGEPATYQGSDGAEHPIPNFEREMQERVVEAFGLHTPESTLAFLEGLGQLEPDAKVRVAIPGLELPEYYSADMDLTLVYDRGDVWYDFPFDENGKSVPQPVRRRPRITLYTQYKGKRIPLARFGTTIGGWRPEKVILEEPTEEEPEGLKAVMWKYKDSPIGKRVWKQIVAAPVWLPPATTPDRALLHRRSRVRRGESRYEVDYHETGPSYASAYGLVAAYHRQYKTDGEGGYRILQDEGIRTHGSVDYMSIMRRHSHGCHRLHNHIAVRLMSFVLKHRPHQVIGQQPISYLREIVHEEETFEMEINKGGYVFELDTPLEIEVLEGRIRGERQEPFEMAIPKYDEDVGAYLTADGRAVQLQGEELVEVTLPDSLESDGGVPDDIFQDMILTDGLLVPAGTGGSAQAAAGQPRSPSARTAATSRSVTVAPAQSAPVGAAPAQVQPSSVPATAGRGLPSPLPTPGRVGTGAGVPRYQPKAQLID